MARQVELEDLLPAASVMVVTVTATTTAGKPLSPDVLSKAQQGCEMALQLDDDKQQVKESALLIVIPYTVTVTGSAKLSES